MKSLQRIVLFVGLVTLAVVDSASALTKRDVASAAVDHYNKRFTPTNLFKLLRITGTTTQDLSEVVTYKFRLQMKETICNSDGGTYETDGCNFKNDGVTMTCNTRVIVPKHSPTQPRVFSINCRTTQVPRFNPEEWAVLARQIGDP
ncbi:cathelicidin-2-like [Heptranchias perlo]|uniref:cathelicidin-2-like n=1 Tax=Heptranchias perlo TaxID=212740 RepID=UPI00355A5715